MKTVVCVLAALIAGCSTTGTAIQIGENSYAPTDKVSLLVAPPDRPHEIIALVEGTAATDDYFTKARTESAAMDAMKKKAASLGANAIVLTGKGSQPYGNVTVGSGNATAYATGNMVSAYGTSTSSSFGWEKITFSGTAIRYTDE